MPRHHLRPTDQDGRRVSITPQRAEWRYLGFEATRVPAGQQRTIETGDREFAIVPLQGSGVFRHGAESHAIRRAGVFTDMPHILYAPPGESVVIEAETDFDVALGSAPAEGRYPPRLFRPDEMKREVRGGGPAVRQVNHVLAPPLPAERLILFEVYVPGGAWSGWPPHCHDGRLGSAYLEETYYYRMEPAEGFALHRNYLRNEPLDEVFAVRDGDLVLVAEGFHPVAAAPGTSVYFLNFLAGELVGEQRSTPPVDDPDHAWILDDWDRGALDLPIEFGSADE